RVLFQRFGYNQISQSETRLGPDTIDDAEEPGSTPMTPMPLKAWENQQRPAAPSTQPPVAPPFYQAFTINVIMVLGTVAFMDFQMGGFASLWTIFLSSTPRSKEEKTQIQLPFRFTGGIGFSPGTIGIAMSILGFV
ncbi:MAG: hypothetical protein M1823_007845, partial [Watsoniomyces obsoletus]